LLPAKAWVLLVCRPHVKGTKWLTHFCVSLLLLSIVSVKLTHTVVATAVSFPLCGYSVPFPPTSHPRQQGHVSRPPGDA
jgi:hypothetical protein